MDKEELKQAIREVLMEMSKEDFHFARFVSQEVPVPKFVEYRVKAPIIEEVFHTVHSCSIMKGCE